MRTSNLGLKPKKGHELFKIWRKRNCAGAGAGEAFDIPVFKGAQVWDFDVLDFYDFFIMKSI